MRTVWITAGLTLALLTAGCGGGGDITPSTTPVGPAGPVTQAPSKNLVVVRLDHDADGSPDLLTLDADQRPLAIVEALRGTPDGGSVDATAAFVGQQLAPEIDDALANHLAESFDLDSETDLEVKVGGEIVTVTVIE